MSRIGSIAGHLWTIAPWVVQQVRPARASLHRVFRVAVPDERWGTVLLRGALSGPARGRTLVVLVHGAGGSKDSPYMIRAAHVAESLGAACLRLDLRGADATGEDIYHAAIDEDLAAALASPVLDRFERVVVAGWSVGGHVALRYALSPQRDPRLAAVATISAPLDLEATVRAIDAPDALVYRRHVLATQKRLLRLLVERRRVPIDVPRALAAETCAEWDRSAICPRFGFAEPAAYYARSAGPHLASLEIPALVVSAKHDPMVPTHTMEPLLARATGDGREPRGRATIEVRLTARGGHVAFPPTLDLGVGQRGAGMVGVEEQIVRWLIERAR